MVLLEEVGKYNKSDLNFQHIHDFVRRKRMNFNSHKVYQDSLQLLPDFF